MKKVRARDKISTPNFNYSHPKKMKKQINFYKVKSKRKEQKKTACAHHGYLINVFHAETGKYRISSVIRRSFFSSKTIPKI